MPWTFTYYVGREVVANDSLSAPWNTDGGANFVDLTLGVIVLQDRGTLLAHRQTHPHGTTAAHGAVNWALSIVFTEKVAKMWQSLTVEVDEPVQSAEGAGPNDHKDE